MDNGELVKFYVHIHDIAFFKFGVWTIIVENMALGIT